MIVFIVIILAMIGVFSLRLYKTQAVVTEESLVAADADSMTYQSTVEAARGNILDRNGNVLVSNRASYNLVIVNFVFFNAPDPNGNLLKVLDLATSSGSSTNRTSPSPRTGLTNIRTTTIRPGRKISANSLPTAAMTSIFPRPRS